MRRKTFTRAEQKAYEISNKLFSVDFKVTPSMRRKVDDTEMDEVYLEEEEPEESYSIPTSPASPPPTPASTGPGLTIVEPPSLRSSSAVTAAPVAPTATAPAAPSESGHGNPPEG